MQKSPMILDKAAMLDRKTPSRVMPNLRSSPLMQAKAVVAELD